MAIRAIGAIGAIHAIRAMRAIRAICVGLVIISHDLVTVCCLGARWLTIVAFSKSCGQLLPDAVTRSLAVCRRVNAEFRVGVPFWETLWQ